MSNALEWTGFTYWSVPVAKIVRREAEFVCLCADPVYGVEMTVVDVVDFLDQPGGAVCCCVAYKTY